MLHGILRWLRVNVVVRFKVWLLDRRLRKAVKKAKLDEYTYVQGPSIHEVNIRPPCRQRVDDF